MSRMVGADPDELDRLAADFERGAGSLESAALRVRTSVHASPWSGARAARFRTDWDQRHGPMLRRTATALRTAAKQLRQQAADQRRASSAGGGGSVRVVAGGARGSAAGGAVGQESPLAAWDLLTETFQLPFGLLGVLGASATLGSNAGLVGRYPAGWARLAKAGDFFKYKRSLNGWFSVNGVGHTLDNIPALGKVGTFAGYLGLASEAGKLATSPSLLGVSQTAAAALKTSKHPVTYLGGMALSSVNMAAGAALETDWSPSAFSAASEYVRANGPGVVVEELGNATVEVFTKRIWSIL
jgi:uncharacterized protein YukE